MRAVLVLGKYAEFDEICAKICGIYICCIYAALGKYAA